MGNEDKVLICYHANCIDGFTSAWVTWKALTELYYVKKENIILKEIMYQSESLNTDVLLEGCKDVDSIFFVDFSIPTDLIQFLVVNKYQVTVIDHHKTAVELYCEAYKYTEEDFTCGRICDDAYILLDKKECGASLCWKFFFNEGPLPKLIQYVRDYDLWKFNYKETKDLNFYFRVKNKTMTSWRELATSLNFNRAEIIYRGKAIRKYHDNLVQDYIEQAEACVFDIQGGPYSGLCTNASGHFASDVGTELALKSKTFGATWYQLKGGNIQWSLRSNGDFDVSKIAKVFGGGGHKNAAGFILTRDSDNNKMYTLTTGIRLWRI